MYGTQCYMKSWSHTTTSYAGCRNMGELFCGSWI